MRIVVMGAGALGGYYGSFLQRGGQDVVYVARGEHLRALQTKGLTIRTNQGDTTIQVNASDNAAAAERADLVFLATKAYGNPEAIAAITPLVGPTCPVLTIQNGVEAVHDLAKAFGPERVIPGAAIIGCGILEPGVISGPVTPGKITIGEMDGAMSERLMGLQNVFTDAGIPMDVRSDLVTFLWQKLLIVGPRSTILTLGRTYVQHYQQVPEAYDLFERLMREYMAVGRAEGAQLEESQLQGLLDAARNATGAWTGGPGQLLSLQRDAEQRRMLEVDEMTPQACPKPLGGITMAAMDVLFDRGLHLPALDLWMDSRRGKVDCWVSHGHTDHIGAHKRFLATAPTAAFLQLHHHRSTAAIVDYGQPVEGPGYHVTLYPAGHCLGSSQLLIEVERTGQRIVYTGDFKLRPSPTAEPCTIVPCDILITECTYGEPRYVFPPEEETLARMRGFMERCELVGETPVVLAYGLGKAQEALHHLLRMGYPVRYDPTIARMLELYRDGGVTFAGDHASIPDAGWEQGTAAVGLVSPGGRRGTPYRSIPRPRTLFLSGWALDQNAPFRMHVNEMLPLSDHADFPELVRYAQECGAQQVYTVNGSPGLAAYLRIKGMRATHLEPTTRPRQLALDFDTTAALLPA